MSSQPEQPIVLVMDDDEDVRFIAEIMLKRLGFGVEFAETGKEAIERYQQAMAEGRRYHAVILDLNVPGSMGGQEAVQRLRALDPAVVAYVTCGNPYDPVVEDPARFGFRGAIPKPFLTEHLQVLLATP